MNKSRKEVFWEKEEDKQMAAKKNIEFSFFEDIKQSCRFV